MDCSLPISSIHGIHQARILLWVAMLSSHGSSQLRYPALAGKFLPLAPPGEPDPSQILPKNRRGRNTSKLILWSQYYYSDGFPGGTVVKNLPAKGLIIGLGRFPGVENGNPLQYSCLKNSMARGAWRAIVHVVTKNRMWLNWAYMLLWYQNQM